MDELDPELTTWYANNVSNSAHLSDWMFDMNATTLTASRLYDLSAIVVPDWDDNYYIDPREVANFYAILGGLETELGETMYRASYRRFVARAWNEAQIENDHRDALIMNEAYNLRVESFTLPSREAQAHALAVMRAREERTLAEVEQLRAEVHRLRQEQITEGGDPRLEQFWERAMEAANEANFCSEYDRLADMMGGPTRSVTYDVDVTVTLRSSVMVTVQRGETPSMEDLRNYVSLSDIESNLSSVEWSDVEVDDYNEVDSY